jgi:ParB family chromosome partitioning protein
MPRAKADQAALREIPLELVDQPELAIRETMDETALEELTESIQQMGVLQPIVVEARDGRYRILAGHRRYIAATRAGLVTVPAVVRPPAGASGEAVTIHENAFREDVNPAEEARYFAYLLEHSCEGDVDKLCRLARAKRGYVEERLLLLRGDPEVLALLKERRISLAVARELNRVRDQGYRRMYLDAAARGGATARIVQEWRIHSERVIPVEPPAPGDGTNQFTALPPPITGMVCFLCDGTEAVHEMELMYVHRACRKVILERFLRGLKGETTP